MVVRGTNQCDSVILSYLFNVFYFTHSKFFQNEDAECDRHVTGESAEGKNEETTQLMQKPRETQQSEVKAVSVKSIQLVTISAKDHNLKVIIITLFPDQDIANIKIIIIVVFKNCY